MEFSRATIDGIRVEVGYYFHDRFVIPTDF